MVKDSTEQLNNKNGRIEARRHAVAELYFKNYSSRVIAEKLQKVPGLETLHHATVCRDIATIKKELNLKQEESIIAARGLSIAKLQQVQRQAWEDYDNSLGRYWGQRTRYLQVIKECEKQISELEGSLSPTKVEHTGEVKVIEVVKDYGDGS